MLLLIILLTPIIIPFLMVISIRKYPKLDKVYLSLALISIYLFGVILALAIYRVLRDQLVFMTEIHSVLLNPVFLSSGAYFGIYVIYILMFSLKRA